jgi:hypothetical protein
MGKGRWEIAWDKAEQGDADECLMPVFLSVLPLRGFYDDGKKNF